MELQIKIYGYGDVKVARAQIRSFVFWKNRRLEKTITTLSDL